MKQKRHIRKYKSGRRTLVNPTKFPIKTLRFKVHKQVGKNILKRKKLAFSPILHIQADKKTIENRNKLLALNRANGIDTNEDFLDRAVHRGRTINMLERAERDAELAENKNLRAYLKKTTGVTDFDVVDGKLVQRYKDPETLKMNANVAHGAGAMFAERKAAIQKAANNEHIKLVDKEPSVVGKAWSKVKKATKRFKKDPEFIDNEDVEFIEGLEKY